MNNLYENKRKPTREGKKLKVGNINAIPEGRSATVQLKDEKEIAVFNVGGKFYAIENFCPHKGFPLADSRLYKDVVECDLHGYRFDVKTGKCLTNSDCSIESYEVLIEDDWIKIMV